MNTNETHNSDNNHSDSNKNESSQKSEHSVQAKKSRPVAAITKKHKSAQGPTLPTPPSGFNPPHGQFGEPSAAMVHDLVGFALIALPAELRALLGDENMVSNSLEIEDQELLVIVREKGVVAYVHLPFLVKEMEFENSASRKDGLVLKDVTHGAATTTTTFSASEKAETETEAETEKPQPKASKKTTKSSIKKGAKP
jgi:hypothetical protein